MTEKELVNRAKIFQGNRLLDGDKVSMGDCMKIILLSKILDKTDLEDQEAATAFLWQKIRKKYLWQRWFF